jgi:hypothetical protein
VGFCFPTASGRRQPQQLQHHEAMKPSPTTAPGNPAAKQTAITALARIYVKLGLPLPAACKAALADYAGFETDPELDQSLCAA